ncbi:MAG TPA: GNAT family N-acetyltransferase [Ornithinibacter sp.]|nr:GNAT family N-acetyltransferase [Ornithinibacter sp.]
MAGDDHGHEHPHEHPHDHEHPPGTEPGPLADASVRRARPNDVPAIGMVQATVFREAYTGRVPDDIVSLFEPDAFARSWRDSLAAPPEGVHRLLVACAGDQVVGLAAIGPSQDPDAGSAAGEVTVLAVHPDARRQGHGSRLLNASVDLLAEAGAESVTLWLLTDDERTRAFLAASGFAPDGAFRDRVVSPAGDTLREVRLTAELGEDPAE